CARSRNWDFPFAYW
nr:immunoglobulin heavy chain junction region [Mus musculus]